MMSLINSNNRKWWVLAAMSVALAMAFIDQSATALALSPIQKEFNASNITLQWIMNSYLLAIAALIIFGGKLGDIIGHRNSFLIGIGIFVISSIACALAATPAWIVFSRLVQGIGGALMMPATGVIVTNTFPDNERGKAMGICVAAASVFLSLGPMLAGILIHFLSWRWIFWINVPLSIICIALALTAIPKPVISAEKKFLDWGGLVTSSIAISSLILALMQGAQQGWQSPIILSMFIVSLVFTGLFIFNEKYAKNPLVNLSLFKNRVFTNASFILLMMQCAFSAMIFWALLLQNVMGYSALQAGFFYLPVTLPVMFLAPLGGRLRDHYGPRLPAVIGISELIVGAIWVGAFASAHSYVELLPGFLLFGFGAPLVYSSIISTAIAAAPLPERGSANGVNQGARQLGNVLGIAIIGSVLSNLQFSYLSHTLQTMPSLIHSFTLNQISQVISGSNQSLSILAKLPTDQMHFVVNQAKSAFTFGFSWCMYTAAFLGLIALVVAFKLPNQPKSQEARV